MNAKSLAVKARRGQAFLGDMPTTYTWVYKADTTLNQDGIEERQNSYAGDDIEDDMLGAGTATTSKPTPPRATALAALKTPLLPCTHPSHHARYPLILRLVVIVLLIPADTSECEVRF